ncbi:aminodeoxychorismate/anthranilate synthase component II [Helicobacter trogontum]|uniref:Anthranilate synthase component II n=1 Tax=Helicobacter trogontum TaxID=50960 RepID=A0ABQ0D2J4_9HELI|nr:aminodeoxychorismate/anthranilate synthase component II [Helicobacter trogontum]MDY5184680.1 aminodeoxychorismate/anthranilate synthase component II [Helicobacter trogontum]
MRVVLIDNFDSFTHNVVYLLREIGIEVIVLRNDCTLQTLQNINFHSLVIAPGPSHPLQSGICLDAIKYFAPFKKILGICLGHQCIAHVFDGEVTPMQTPQHGKTSHVTFNDHPLFHGIRAPLRVGRYHSLHVSKLGKCEALAWSEDGIIMALQAKGYQTYGIQFHPESILQEQGKKLLKNFFDLC